MFNSKGQINVKLLVLQEVVIIMVGQVVGAAAPVILQSATDEDGLVNRLFKLVFIGAVIASFVLVILGLFLAFNIWNSIGGTLTDLRDFVFTPLSFIPGLGILAGPVTGLITAFTTRR